MPVLRIASAPVIPLIVFTFLLYFVYIRLPAQDILVPQVPVTDNRFAQQSAHMVVGLPILGQTTKSYWLQDDANPLAREGANSSFVHEDVDIVIIGSGITGSSAAHHLVQEMKNQRFGQLRVVVLEARDFCSGATGRNGGHFITLPYDGFTARSKRTLNGRRDEGVLAAELEMRTIKVIRSLIATHGWEDDVQVKQNGHTRLFFTDEEEEEDLVEYTAAKSAGVPWDGISRLTKEEMFERYGTSYPGVSIPAGSLWGLKLSTKLFQLAISDAQAASISLQLHTHTPVEAMERLPPTSQSHSRARWVIRTPRGNLKTRFVIHATNAWASYLLPQFAMPNESSTLDKDDSPPYGTWIAPARGQIMATRAKVPPSELPQRAFAADWMEDYWLLAPIQGTSDESNNALIIYGGGRNSNGDASELGNSDDTALDPEISASLRTRLPKVYPQFFNRSSQPEMEWTGIQAFTDTGDPIVGPVPDSTNEGKYLPGQFISGGYNGHGMSRAYSCAEAVVQMIFKEMQTKEGSPCFTRPDWLPSSFTTLHHGNKTN